MTIPKAAQRMDAEDGFTLIEVLIAIFIFSLVLTMLFTSFRQISLSAALINTSGNIYEMAQGGLTIMERDLGSVHVTQKPAYTKPTFGGDPDPFRFQGDTALTGNAVFPILRFTTLSHLPVDRDNRKGVAEVVYYVDESDEYGFMLRRSDRLFFSEEFEKKKTHPVLLRNIKSMKVTYYDQDGYDHADWDSESDQFGYATPTSILIHFEIGDDDNVLPFETRVMLRCVREKSE
jgi:general secretion pathway protein J